MSLLNSFRIVLAGLTLCAASPQIHAQGSTQCPPFAEQRNRQGTAESDRAVRIASVQSVEWRGRTQLPVAARDEITASLQRVENDSDLGSDLDWVERIREQVRGGWQNSGYFQAQVEVTVVPHSSDPDKPVVSLVVEVKEGAQYRLSDLRFASSDPNDRTLLFAPAILRPLFPIREEDILDVSKIREGIEAVQELYGAQGYIDAVVEPDVEIDEAARRISLEMRISEGQQFILEAIRFLGLRAETIRRLNLKMKPGYPFDNRQFEEFFVDNTHVLPTGASPANANIERNQKTATLRLTFDFRPCTDSRASP